VAEWKQHCGGEDMHPIWINQPHHSAPSMAHLTVSVLWLWKICPDLHSMEIRRASTPYTPMPHS
jgi:hypothetical protein